MPRAVVRVRDAHRLDVHHERRHHGRAAEHDRPTDRDRASGRQRVAHQPVETDLVGRRAGASGRRPAGNEGEGLEQVLPHTEEQLLCPRPPRDCIDSGQVDQERAGRECVAPEAGRRTDAPDGSGDLEPAVVQQLPHTPLGGDEVVCVVDVPEEGTLLQVVGNDDEQHAAPPQRAKPLGDECARRVDPSHVLEAFRQATGCPVIVNTSFNVRGEPIVCTPEDAYRCFMRTEMDVLVLEDCVLDKADQPAVTDDQDWRQTFELD